MGRRAETRDRREVSRRVSPGSERLARMGCGGRGPGLVRVGVRGLRHGPSPLRRAAGKAKSEPTRPVLLAMVSLLRLCAGTGRKLRFVMTTGPPLSRVATPLHLQSIKRPRAVNENRRPIAPRSRPPCNGMRGDRGAPGPATRHRRREIRANTLDNRGRQPRLCFRVNTLERVGCAERTRRVG